MAGTWLKSNCSQNRALRISHVEYLASEITQGHWQVTHQGIAFNDKGELIDGQHRLAAIVQAGKAITIPVTYDVASNSEFSIIDRGITRTASDITGLPSSLIQIYNAFCNVARNKDAKRSMDDLMKIHQSSFGDISTRLVAFAPTAMRIFGTAPFKCAAVVSVAHGGDEESIFNVYRNLVLNNMADLTPVATGIMKMVLRDNWLGSRRPTGSVYSLGMYCFASKNESVTRPHISEDARRLYVSLAAELLDKCLK